MQLNWQTQQNEIEQPTRTGEVLARTNIKTLEIPFGFIWLGMPVVTDSSQQLLSAPKYKIMFNNILIAKDINTQDEAVEIAEKWLLERVKVSYETFKDFILKSHPDQEVIAADLVQAECQV